ncbi:hypothetical protein WG906_12435 [Pedobacter sp. P351]|uniref:hypothetical protein n=1 Tax=Pedobacter superstes TaxID=3133441 RepID=UPI0030A0CA0A
MYQKTFFSLFLLALVLFSGCGKSNSQKKLELREKELQLKEKKLLNLDQQLKLKEQDLSKREQRLDSLKNNDDTLGVYNPKLVGSWLITMQCIETTCEGYAVGDTKTEQWNIAYQNNRVIIKAISNKKIIRTYSGFFRENSLNLTAVPPPDAHTEMSVVLNPHDTNDKLMEGQRVIDRTGNCRVVFTLKAEKL